MPNILKYNPFECTSQEQTYAGVNPGFVPLIGRIKSFDAKIQSIINNLYNTVEPIYQWCIDNNCSQKSDLEDFTNELQNNKYQKFFSNNFNKEKSFPDENFTSNYIYAMDDLITVLMTKFPDYYLMCKTISHYDCCYLDTIRLLFDFSNQFLFSGNLLCVFAGDIMDFENKINDLINYINTNNIDPNESESSAAPKKAQNAADAYILFINYKNDLKSNIQTKREDLINLLSYIKRFFAEIPAYLKAISITQIIFSSSSEDDSRFERFSQVLLDNPYNPSSDDINYKLLSSITKYYETKIHQYGIPAILNNKQFLKSDWSNFNSLSKQTVRTAADLAGIGQSGVCPNLYSLLSQYY